MSLAARSIACAAAGRAAVAALAALAGAGLAGCSPLGVAVTAAGIATDTSITWEVVKHVHGKLTEDQPTPCLMLDGVRRALNPRCDYRPGQIARTDFAKAGLQECPLATATRDPRLWRALPELIEKGPPVERCAGSPLAGLAAVEACPDFAAAGAPEREALLRLAETDPRAVRHDVMRLLSCPVATAAGLDRALGRWQARGWLDPQAIGFSPLGALHPDQLATPLAASLLAAGHRPEAALDGYEGVQPPGYELALRDSHWPAIDWWLARVPRLANTVPPSRGAQLAWVPLQRVLLPGWLAHPETQGEAVRFLLARGADPRQRLPHDPSRTVLAWAKAQRSPHLAALDPEPPRADAPGGTPSRVATRAEDARR